MRITLWTRSPGSACVRMLGRQTGPFLKKLVVSSESANNVYLEKVDVYNMYAMSESGFAVGIFLMRQCLSRRVHDAVFVGRNNNRITSAVSVMIQKRTISEHFFCCCTRGTIIIVSIFSWSGCNQYGENIQTHTFGQYPIYSAGDSGHLFHFAGSNCCSVGTFGV